MQENNIRPEKITKPIQLLAAWLIGLIVLVGLLLAASYTIKSPIWLIPFFGISAVAIIPMFLCLIFLLQTKYRPEMQEDSFYSKYLDQNTLTFKYLDKGGSKEFDAIYLKDEIVSLSQQTKEELDKIKTILQSGSMLKIEESKIEKIIENSDTRLDDLKKLATLSTINLQINYSIPHYGEIVEKIKKIGFIKYEEFGEGKRTPEKIIISFGKLVSINIIRELVFELSIFGVTHIKGVKFYENSINNSAMSIYVGSYATLEDSILIDEGLIEILKNMDDTETLSHLMVRYMLS